MYSFFVYHSMFTCVSKPQFFFKHIFLPASAVGSTASMICISLFDGDELPPEVEVKVLVHIALSIHIDIELKRVVSISRKSPPLDFCLFSFYLLLLFHFILGYHHEISVSYGYDDRTDYDSSIEISREHPEFCDLRPSFPSLSPSPSETHRSDERTLSEWYKNVNRAAIHF